MDFVHLLLTAVAAVAAAAAAYLSNRDRQRTEEIGKAVGNIHTDINSRVSELVVAIQKVARLEGMAEGRADRISEETEENKATISADGATGLIMTWSIGANKLLGWSAQEIVGRPVDTIVPERYRQMHNEAWQACTKAKRPPRRGPIASYAVTKTGREIPMSLILSAWTVGEQRIFQIIMTARSED